MTWEGWFVLGVIGLVVGALVGRISGPDVVMLGGLGVLMTGGMFTERLPGPVAAVAGFGNVGPITVGVLFVVAAGLTQTGALQGLAWPLLGRPGTVRRAQARLMGPIALGSGFVNNTPIVAMFMPVVDDWAKRNRLSPSKLLIPLSYAAILGGLCTLVGTSTNLVVNGLLISQGAPDGGAGSGGLGFFEIGAVGLPCAIVGVAYVVAVGPRLLPQRHAAFHGSSDPRQYTVEMLVEPGGPLVGQTIEQAALRGLAGLYLVEIDRGEEVLAAPGPAQSLAANDRLVFAGVVDSVVDLRKRRGLVPATDQVFKLHTRDSDRTLIEAVVSSSCPLIGRTIREGRFRTMYHAAVIAVARHGKRIEKKVGDIVLEPGDTLLLEAHRSFADQQRNSRDFFLVSQVTGSTPPRHNKAPWALGILAAMVGGVALTPLTMLNGALLAAGGMWLSRCLTGSEARQAVDWQVLVVIGAALGLGQALDRSGAAGQIAGAGLEMIGPRPWLALALIYLLTNVASELVTNTAAAVMVFPIARSAAQTLEVSFMPFVIVVMIAASASFATPIGYQTNLMVSGPGGYQYTDYLRFGLPLNALIMALTLALTPTIWPF